MSEPVWDAPPKVRHGEGASKFLADVRVLRDACVGMGQRARATADEVSE
jgi:hypothetical protein